MKLISKKYLKDETGGLATILLVVLGLFTFFVGVIILGVWLWSSWMKDFPAYHVAKKYITFHPSINVGLGEIQEWDSFPWGRFSYNKTSGVGTLYLDLKGSQARGRVTLELVNEFETPWLIKQATLKIANQKEPIDLETPQQWLNNALDFLKKRNFDDARKFCELIEQAVPDDYRDEICYAEIALDQDDKNLFLEIRKSLVDKNPNYDRYQVFLAYAHHILGENEKSIEYYKKAWELNPDPQTASSLAYLYLIKNESETARGWLEKAREKGGKSPELAYRYGWYYFTQKDYTKAIEHLNIAKNLDPNYAMPYFGLAYVHEEMDEKHEPIFYFEQGINRDPTGSLIHRKNLIDHLMKYKYYDEAIFHLLRASIYHPKDIPSLVVLSKLYQRQGRSKSAKIVLDEAKKIDPEKTDKTSREFEYLLWE